MKKFTNEDSSHRFRLHTDSNLVTLNRVAEYFRPWRVFTGVESIQNHETEREKDPLLLR